MSLTVDKSIHFFNHPVGSLEVEISLVLKVSRECSYPERLHNYSGQSRVIRGWREGGRKGGRKGGCMEAWRREAGREAGRKGGARAKPGNQLVVHKIE